MLSFRHSITLIAAAALTIAIVMLMHAHDTSNVAAASGGHLTVLARPSPVHMSFPRASTRADELANTNHEGF